jgi:hypothetical protein
VIIANLNVLKNPAYSDTSGISLDSSNVEIYDTQFYAKQGTYYYKKHEEIGELNGYFI